MWGSPRTWSSTPRVLSRISCRRWFRHSRVAPRPTRPRRLRPRRPSVSRSPEFLRLRDFSAILHSAYLGLTAAGYHRTRGPAARRFAMDIGLDRGGHVAGGSYGAPNGSARRGRPDTSQHTRLQPPSGG